MGLGSALGFTKSGSHKAAEKAYRDEHGQEVIRRKKLESGADDARNRYVQGLNEFDPQEYMASAAGAVGERLNESLVETQSRSSQQLNQRGFYGGGINTARITRDFSDRLSNALAALSFDAAGLELSRLGGYGDLYGADANRVEGARSQELDVLADVLGAHQDEKAQKLAGTTQLAGGGMKFLGGL